ncbi:hypothetical protein CORC01_10269 [Colletotrichum orchidophilum]|uniref:Uncharacterized protein n=1 Tax=Colletotrichum orchidophilum TaxID=1209926 RepID=A0A1G4AZ54_9PEZI|nr:uncharacterized protein CORC01_10269 [Colletotrichum orchidophilum]OHE94450.1 hypothetical protein CORC01_10269 [Colletotrichum orchidophilum]
MVTHAYRRIETLKPHNNGTGRFHKLKKPTKPPTIIMPFFYSKPIGGRNFGTSVHADRHGIRRGPWRMRIGRFNCFR